MRVPALALLLAASLPAAAEVRPQARPVAVPQVSSLSPRLERPVARPDERVGAAALRAAIILDAATRQAVRVSARPVERTDEILAMARRAQRERAEGAVCGNLQIQGEVVPPVSGRGACGIASPVRVRSVAGVALSTPALMDCPTADALYRWVEQGVKPAIGDEGGGLSRLRVVAHYACRTRNNRPGGRLSEHARGHAIDIAGFGLRDGSEISVLDGWRSAGDGAQLRQIHREACGPFGTVLGPEADRYHQDHFHLDTARYRSGPYCR